MIITKQNLEWLKAFSETSIAEWIHDKALMCISVGNLEGLKLMRRRYKAELIKFMRGS